jgi:hypothetical protein
MLSVRGLPSGYAVLYYMLDAQLFLSLSPYLRESTVCCNHDSLGVTQVTHHCMGYKPLDLTLFSLTGFEYIWRGMSHNPPKTTTRISSTTLYIVWFMAAPDTHIDSRSCFLSPNFRLLSMSSKNSSITTNAITYLNMVVLFMITEEHSDFVCFCVSNAFDIIFCDLLFVSLGIWCFFCICQAE